MQNGEKEYFVYIKGSQEMKSAIRHKVPCACGRLALKQRSLDFGSFFTSHS